MKKRRTSRFLAIVLLVAMTLSLMPATAFAEDTSHWELVTDAGQILKDGTTQYAIIGVDAETQETFALGGGTSATSQSQVYLTGDDEYGYSILTVTSEDTGVDIKNNNDFLWLRESNTKLCTVTSGSGVNLATTLTMKGSNQGSKIAFTNDADHPGFLNLYTDGGTKYALSYNSAKQKFEMTKASTSSNATIKIYVLVESSIEPLDPTAPATPTASVASGAVLAGTTVTFSTTTPGATIYYSLDNGENWIAGNSYTINEAVTILVRASLEEQNSEIAVFSYTIAVLTPIADVLAADSGTFSVKGVVTLVDGRNIFVQDETGGINLYFAAAPTDIALGDTLIGTGTRGEYKGLPQLSGASFEKSEGLSLTPRTTTLDALSSADLCCYVCIENLTVTEVNGDNTTVSDGNGNSFILYKAISEPKLAVGNRITFTGALGIYTYLQLRNTLASEIVFTGPAAPVADVNPGTVEANTVVGFTTATEGAEISYSVDNGSSWIVGSSFTVTETVTILVRATLDGVVGPISTFTYTVESAQTGPLLDKFTEAPADGSQVVIFYPASNLALTSTASGAKLAGTAATPADGRLAYTEEMALLTVAVSDGVYTFANEAGLFLTSAQSGSGLSFAADGTSDLAKWTLVQQSDGTWHVMNVGAAYNGNHNQALEYYNGFTTYGVKDNNAQYKFDFYGIAPAVQHYGLVTDLADLTDGAYVVIYNPGNSLALTSEAYQDWYLLAGAVTIVDGQIPEPAANQVWKVTKNADGSYSFTQGEKAVTGWLSGNYQELTSNASHDGASTGWNLTPCNAENSTFFMSNSSISNFYIQVYSKSVNGQSTKVFCGYKSGTNEQAYGMQFYLVPAPEEPVEPPTPIDDSIKVGTLVTDRSQLTDGATVLIYSPTHKTAASSVPNGDWYLKAVGPVTDSFTAPLVWTVSVNEDGTYSFSNGDNVLSAWLSGNYVELTVNPNYNDETVSTWHIDPCNAATHTWFICNSTLTLNGSGCYVEAYEKNGSEVFSGYSVGIPTEANFGLQFYLVNPDEASAEIDDGSWDGVLNKGSSYVIYNASAEGVMGIPNEMGIALTNVPATIENNKAVVANGALVFTVADNPGRYYVLEVGGKYLATNNAEELLLLDEINEYTKWYLKQNGSGYTLYNKTANYNGNPVCIEFFSGTFSGWTFKSNAEDPGIYVFNFYALADNIAVVNGVAQVPLVVFACDDSRYVEQDYEVKFTLDDLAPEISSIDITYTVGDVTNRVEDYTVEGKTYSFTIPAAELDAQGVVESFKITVQVSNSNGLSYQGVKTVTVVDEPFIGRLTPAANAQTLEDKRPVISAEIGNVGENAVFTMTVNDQPVEAVYENGVLSYQAAEDMEDGRCTVIVTVTRSDGKTAEKMWSFTVGKADYQLYFGQLHSHTTYSDGSGSLDAALAYIAAIPDSDNIQFVAFTDHSNYFDTKTANPEGALYDMSQAGADSQQLWNDYKSTVAAFNASHTGLLAIAGFEMTWSGGPGHINTFNTPGIVSRNNATLNNKTNDAGMKAYYALLDQTEGADSLSQFNHPGKTFGNFTDFSYWDALTDSRIFLVEVGNGEGQIGAGGYYPSYEQYIMALDKGWHVGPTNNQDNHKGRWGNANAARDVILTDDFSEQGIYNAIRQYRIYATEDKNLEIQYQVNGEPLGTIFAEVPEELNFVVTLYDPDSSDSISKVELVANSGAVAYTWNDANELASGQLEVTLAPTYSYYFVRVTQKDGDLAVTAPVWVGESLKLGISSVECSASTPVTNEEFTLTTTLFNSEASAATIKSVTYTTNGSVVLGTDTAAGSIPAGSTSTVEFKYTPDKAKIMTITVTAVVELDGVEYVFTRDIELEIQDADALVYIGIDASHYNEYVAGNYKDSMGNFGALAAGYGVRTVELRTSEELIAACGNEKYVAIIFTAPSRRDGKSLRDPYANYSDAELAAVQSFNARGGMVIVSGWSDDYESYSAFPAADHMAAQQNKLLETLGSSIRLGDDAVVDDELNGGQNPRLYLDAFNFDSYLMEGVVVDPDHPNDRNYSEVYSNYGGCSVYFTGSGVPATVTPIVYGHETTYTKDCDSDGRNELVYPYGDGSRVVVMASEELEGKGRIIVAGAAFMSNFEVQAQISDGSSDADQQKNYANYKICENLVKDFNEVTVTPIANVQAQTEIGLVYTIEGVVTSNASGYDKDTAFFDCIYVQDDTAGICCFPVSGNYKIGDKVRIKGYTDFYQAEMELQVMSIEKIGEADPVEPIEVTASQINDLNVLGSLVTLKGTVESFELENDLVQTIIVRSTDGELARVFIDGYITTSQDVQNLAVGCLIEATGISSYDDTWKDTNFFPRIRVRSRADIVCTPANPDAAVVYAKSLSLKGNIAINIYLDLPEAVRNDENAYVTFGSDTILVSNAIQVEASEKTLYRFTTYVKFSQLTEDRVLHLYNSSNELVALQDMAGKDLTETGMVYCAQDYIEYIRAHSKDADLLALVNALSDVGSLAQAYFEYNLDNRAELVCDLSGVSAATVEGSIPNVEQTENTGVSYYASSLVLKENTRIRHYFRIEGDVSAYSFTVNGEPYTPTSSNGYYRIEISDIVAKDLDKVYHLEISTADSGVVVSVDFCALSYVYKVLIKGENSNLTDLLKALTLYSQAAEVYFNKPEQQ